jgi:hypothetical protein
MVMRFVVFGALLLVAALWFNAMADTMPAPEVSFGREDGIYEIRRSLVQSEPFVRIGMAIDNIGRTAEPYVTAVVDAGKKTIRWVTQHLPK